MNILILIFFLLFYFSFSSYSGITLKRILTRFAHIDISIGLSLAIGSVLTVSVGTLVGLICGLCEVRGHNVVIATELFILFVGGIFSLILRDIKLGITGKRFKERFPQGINLILAVAAVLLMIFQIVGVEMYRYEGHEAIRSISIATKVFDTEECFKGLSIMNFWGSISYLIGVHPLKFIYTFLPIVLIPSYYLGYYELLKIIGDDNNTKSALTGLIVIELLNIWGYQSELLVPVTMLLAWSLGPCFILHGLLPPIAAIVLLYIKSRSPGNKKETGGADDTSENTSEDDDYLEEWDMKKHKIINARNLAIAFAVLAVALVAFVYILNTKINALHDATANLQVDLNNRCSIYEFAPNGDAIEGYLVKASDGSLTMVGGGSAENGEALSEFLEPYGTELSGWYLYGLEEQDAGAYMKCIQSYGVKTENVYLISRTKLEL